MASPYGSDHEDDAAFEEAAAKDAFGLSSFTSPSKGKAAKDSKAGGSKGSKAAEASTSVRKALVTNPDVLTEVCLPLRSMIMLFVANGTISNSHRICQSLRHRLSRGLQTH